MCPAVRYMAASAHLALAYFHSSRLYLLIAPLRSERHRLPVHDFISPLPVDPLRKINNLAVGQFTTLFHGYTWVVGADLPEFLRLYNQWTIAIHFSLALIGVSAGGDADAVVEDRRETRPARGKNFQGGGEQIMSVPQRRQSER